MEVNEIVGFIKKLDFYKELSEDELNILAGKMKAETFKPGAFLFVEAGKRDGVFVIYSGEVELTKKNPKNEIKRLAWFSPGEMLGEGTFIDDSPHSTSAVAVTTTTCICLFKDDINAIFAERPDLGMKISAKLARVISVRMRSATTRFVTLGSQYLSGEKRREHDLLGDKDVPMEVNYGIQTLRALENFDITGVPLSFYPDLVKGLAMVKKASARANHELGLLSDEIAKAIDDACTSIINGRYHKCFVVDMIQGGAGTSANMNANEVIANVALQMMGHEKGEYKYCHPNNHVNLSQSTNDAYPTAMKIALVKRNKMLVKALMNLIVAFKGKSVEFADVIKMGRTQLQDAVPMTLGQAFEAYAVTLEEEIERLTKNANLFLEVNMGATAIGTGINSDPDYTPLVIGHLREITGLDIVSARNLVKPPRIQVLLSCSPPP
jgi:aspartate ammonia-lyase